MQSEADGWLTTDGAVPMEDVLYASTQAVQEGMLRLAQQLGTRMTEAHRRRALRDALAEARATLERVLLLVRWASDSHAHATAVSDALSAELAQQDTMRRAADDLFHLHRAMPLAVAPPADVFAAVDILSTGTYSQLPGCIRAPVPEDPPSRRQAGAALRWLRGELRKKKAHWRLPAGVCVEPLRGALRCFVHGEYELAITAEGARAPAGLGRGPRTRTHPPDEPHAPSAYPLCSGLHEAVAGARRHHSKPTEGSLDPMETSGSICSHRAASSRAHRLCLNCALQPPSNHPRPPPRSFPLVASTR